MAGPVWCMQRLQSQRIVSVVMQGQLLITSAVSEQASEVPEIRTNWWVYYHYY
jgi:hypothetical protein